MWDKAVKARFRSDNRFLKYWIIPQHHSMYLTEPLERAFGEAFGESLLFDGEFLRVLRGSESRPALALYVLGDAGPVARPQKHRCSGLPGCGFDRLFLERRAKVERWFF